MIFIVVNFNFHGLTHRRIGWNTHLQWMRYIVYLAYLFSKKPIGHLGSDAFISIGLINNRKNVKDGMNCPLIRHVGKDPNSQHKIAMKCCEDLKNYSRHIDKLIEKQTSKELENNRLQLKTSIECGRWLTFQACAFRGHDESLD